MTGENVVLSFAKNDLSMEKACEFPKSDLDGQAIFPAICTKNQIIELNFGQMVSFIPHQFLLITSLHPFVT